MRSESTGRTVWLEHPEGRVSVEELGDGRRRVVAFPLAGGYISRRECATRYPVELIARILEIKAPSYAVDEIAREEDPKYVERALRSGLLGYVAEQAFAQARVLDFGSGAGASSVILARLFPGSEIVGIELEADLVDIAERRVEHYGLANVRFLRSPDPQRLPLDLGQFDFINLSAVYEHLLPQERPRLMSRLFTLLKPNGVIFVNQLPHRFCPIEAHTTGLPLLNYLPDWLACATAIRFSKRIAPDDTWPNMLRNGIRGGTARSVKRDLERDGGRAQMLQPSRLGLHDHADLWYRDSSAVRPHPAKPPMRIVLKVIERTTGQPFAPGLSLAFAKIA